MTQPKKQVRTSHNRLKIIEEVEKNPGEKLVYTAKRLGLAASTLNSIFAKKEEIRQQIENLKVRHPCCVEYKIQCIKSCVYSHKHAVKTQQISKIVSLYHK